MKLCNPISDRAAAGGWTWAVFQYLFLPSLLYSLGARLSLGEADLNGIYYILNFCAAACVFRRLLAASVSHALRHPWRLATSAALAFCVNFAAARLMGMALAAAAPEFVNANDAAVMALYRSRPKLIFTGVVFLVPVAEECLFRGLIFGRLHGKSRALAWALSAAAFAFVHVMGYIGAIPHGALMLCLLQYIPAGLCLCWAYERSGSLLAPILVHAATNAAAFLL